MKTMIENITVITFLKEKYDELDNFKRITGGQLAQAFSFTTGKREYIIKIRRDLYSINKESTVTEKILEAYPDIPVPKIHESGEIQTKDGTFYFAISDKCIGRIAFKQENRRLIIKSMLELLYDIHQVDISETRYYGDWSCFSEAKFESWREFLDHYIEEKAGYLLEYFSDKSAEIEYISCMVERIRSLIPYCSEERSLIHGDFGMNNLMANDEGDITGVFDWEISKFGDFVYDLGWLNYWGLYVVPMESFHSGYLDIYGGRKGGKIPYFEERVLCYTLCTHLHMLWFFCLSGQTEDYDESKQKMENFKEHIFSA